MSVIDIAIARAEAEAVIAANVQVLLRDRLPGSVFEQQSPLPAVPFGGQVFQRILLGKGPDTMAPDDGIRAAFFITALNVTNARLMPRRDVRAPPVRDDPNSSLDDIDSGEEREHSVLLPVFSPATSRDARYEREPLGVSRISVLEAAVALDIQIVVQNQEGVGNRSVQNSSIEVTAFVGFEIRPETQVPFFGMGAGQAAPYSLRLVPRIINVAVGTAFDLISLMRTAYAAARELQLLGPPGGLFGTSGASPDVITRAQWRTMAETLRGLYEGINRSLADAALDLNTVAALFGAGKFVPNAAISLTPNQLRLRVQVESQAQWFDPSALDDVGPARVQVATAMRRELFNSWRAFLTSVDDIPFAPGTSVAVRAGPEFALTLVGDALRDLFAQRSTDNPIARAVLGLRESLHRSSIPGFVLPFSGIALPNEYLDRRIMTDAAGRARMTWSWTLRFLDICPLLASDIDIDFRLSFAAESARPATGGTSETDLLLFVRLDFDIHDWDAVRCLGPLLATFLPLIAHAIGIAPPVLALILAVVAQSVVPSSVRREVEATIDDALVGAIAGVLSTDASRVSADVALDDDGMTAFVRVANGTSLLWSLPEMYQVLQALTPLGRPERVGGPFTPDVALRMAPDGGLVMSLGLPSRAFVFGRLTELLAAEAERNEAWRARHTLGPDAPERFSWGIDRCRLADDGGAPLVEEARYTFAIAQAERFPWSMRVFSVSVVQTPALMQNLSRRFAVDGLARNFDGGSWFGRGRGSAPPLRVPGEL